MAPTPLLDPHEILSALELTCVEEKKATRRSLPADPTESRLLSEMGLEPMHADELSARLDLPIETVSATLTVMELKGMVRQVGGMSYVAVRESAGIYGALMTDNNYYAVIMAGGGGTRLWPLSRRKRPKQLLKLVDNTSMFAMAVNRLRDILPVERILVVTVADQAALLQQDVPDIPSENYLIEPMPRGTASVVGLAAIKLQKIAPEATMAVLTADHYIRNIPLFHELLEFGWETAQDDWLVTLGIHPTFPSTGYGYIQHAETIQKYRTLPVHRVLKFKEKPDLETAKAMLASGDHDWNSGMFIWKVDNILAEFKQQMPELHAGLTRIAGDLGTTGKPRPSRLSGRA